jgi:hypothetical protein
MVSGYGPRNRSPLKWTTWSGSSAIQTSVSLEICPRNRPMSARVAKAVTNTKPDRNPAKSSLSSRRLLPSTTPALVTASPITSHSRLGSCTTMSGILAAESISIPSRLKLCVPFRSLCVSSVAGGAGFYGGNATNAEKSRCVCPVFACGSRYGLVQ